MIYDPVFQQWREPNPEPEPAKEPESIEDWAREIHLRYKLSQRQPRRSNRRYDLVFGQWYEQPEVEEPPEPEPLVCDPVFDWAARRLELLDGTQHQRIFLRYNENHDESGRFASSDSSGVGSATLERISSKAYDITRAKGGVTIDLEGDQPSEGYAYAPSKDTEKPIPADKLTPEDIDSYIDAHYDELSQEGNHLGMWTEGDNVYLDVSQVGPPDASTIEKAQGANQLAVFDLKTFDTIDIGKMGSRGYERTGKASDLHNQHQGQVKGATESRSATGLSEVSRRAEERTEVSRFYAEPVFAWVRNRIWLRYNENHDELGRFAESDSSGGGSEGGSGSSGGGGKSSGSKESKGETKKELIPPKTPIMPGHPSMADRKPSTITDEDIDTMSETILDRYNNCTDEMKAAGAVWYSDASDLIRDVAEANGFTEEQGIAIAAAISPGTKWEPDNVMYAVQFMSKFGDSPNANPDLELHWAGQSPKTNEARAERVMHSEHPIEDLHTPTGQKIYNFARNLQDPTNEARGVTVDTWAARAATNCDKANAERLISRAGYEKVAEAYRRAADKAGVSPAAMQATVWLHIKK